MRTALDKRLDFVINNWRGIVALLQVHRDVQTALVDRVNSIVVEAMEGLEGFFGGLELKYENDGKEIFWYDPKLYQREKYIGVYFGYSLEESNYWEWLTSDDRGEAFGFYLGFADYNISASKKAMYLREWALLLNSHNNKSRLKKQGIIVSSEEKGDIYLAHWPLYREVNMEALKNPTKMGTDIQRAAKSFTSALLPILRKKK